MNANTGGKRVLRIIGAAWFAAILLFQAPAAHAAEKGLMIRADKLMAQPFIDAAKGDAVAANQPVTVLERRGGWVNVEAGGKRGWVRLLNVRLEPPGGVAAIGKGKPAKSSGSPLSIFQTNSSKQTATTGIKGVNDIDEASIRNASVNYAELDRLETLDVTEAQARGYAAKNKLKEQQLGYLKKGKGK